MTILGRGVFTEAPDCARAAFFQRLGIEEAIKRGIRPDARTLALADELEAEGRRWLQWRKGLPSSEAPRDVGPEIAPPSNSLNRARVGTRRVADLLGCSSRQVTNLAVSGALPAWRDDVGSPWFFELEDVRAFAATRGAR